MRGGISCTINVGGVRGEYLRGTVKALWGIDMKDDDMEQILIAIKSDKVRDATPEGIICEAVTDYYGMGPVYISDLRGKGRNNHRTILSRYLYYYFYKRFINKDISWKELGRMFGKDHSNVIYGVGVIEDGLSLGRGEIWDLAEIIKGRM